VTFGLPIHSDPFALISWRNLQQFSSAGERLLAHNWLSNQCCSVVKPDASISSPDRSPKPLAQGVGALPKVRLLLEALKTGLALCSECHLMGSASSC
jgi:hypothetical protein